MKNLKRQLRLIAYIILIAMASLGIGLVGGIPIPTSNKKNEGIAIEIQKEETEEDSQTLDIKDIL